MSTEIKTDLENLGVCYDCKKPFETEGNKNLVDGNLYVCDKCRSGDYLECRDCGGIIHKDNARVCDNCGNDYCEDCFGNNSCDNCDDRFCSERCQDGHYQEYHQDENNDGDELPLRIHASEYKPAMAGQKGKIVTSPRAFGVEIECYYPDMNAIDTAAEELPLHLGIQTDGSLKNNGVEFQTPKLYAKTGEEFVEQVCRTLNAKKFFVDKTCGLHIHLDANSDYFIDGETENREITSRIKNLWLFYLAFNDCLIALLPHSRRKSTYCLPLSGNYLWKDISKCYDLADLESKWYKYHNDDSKLERREIERRKKNHTDDTRYNGVNMHTLFAEGHLEIRYHSGTIDAKKIFYWVELHQRIMDRIGRGNLKIAAIVKAFDMLTLTEKLKEFWKLLELPEANQKYFEARLKKFNPALVVEQELLDDSQE